MPGSTPAHQIPYAVPTDPLVQWPATSQALAEKVDALSTTAAGAPQRQVIQGVATCDAQGAFHAAFPPNTFYAAPSVTVTPVAETGYLGSGHLSTMLAGAPSAIAADGFVYMIGADGVRGPAAGVVVQWIAVGPGNSSQT
jgi:hypothetical protein